MGRARAVLVLWALAFPALLLLLLVAMEKLEARVAMGEVRQELLARLDTAFPDEVEDYVARTFAATVDDYWRRVPRVRRPALRRPGATARPTTGGRSARV